LTILDIDLPNFNTPLLTRLPVLAIDLTLFLNILVVYPGNCRIVDPILPNISSINPIGAFNAGGIRVIREICRLNGKMGLH